MLSNSFKQLPVDTREVTKKVVSTAVSVTYSIAKVFMVERELHSQKNFQIDKLREDMIPSSFNIHWFVSLENGTRGPLTPL